MSVCADLIHLAFEDTQTRTNCRQER